MPTFYQIDEAFFPIHEHTDKHYLVLELSLTLAKD